MNYKKKTLAGLKASLVDLFCQAIFLSLDAMADTRPRERKKKKGTYVPRFSEFVIFFFFWPFPSKENEREMESEALTDSNE